jgi:voltage-dependent potassium channel beta subunit
MSMVYRRLGRSGLQVSALSLGSWLTFGNQIDDYVAEKLMHTAYDAGVNFFDNAEVYAGGKSEEVMGRILAKSGWRRDTFLVSSKVFWGGDLPNQRGLSRKHVIEACHAALKRLQVDYLDMYFCHRPDIATPVEETVRAMSDLIAQGKVLYWGTSEWSGQEIQEAYSCARQYNLVPPTMEQPQYNMFHRERFEKEYNRLYQNEVGLGTTIWSPLAGGLLTGKYQNARPENSRVGAHSNTDWVFGRLGEEEAQARVAKVGMLMEVATRLDIPMPLLALTWCLANPNVSTVILGATKVEQLEQNLRATELLPLLTHEVLEEIEAILENKPKLPSF